MLTMDVKSQSISIVIMSNYHWPLAITSKKSFLASVQTCGLGFLSAGPGGEPRLGKLCRWKRGWTHCMHAVSHTCHMCHIMLYHVISHDCPYMCMCTIWWPSYKDLCPVRLLGKLSVKAWPACMSHTPAHMMMMTVILVIRGSFCLESSGASESFNTLPKSHTATSSSEWPFDENFYYLSNHVQYQIWANQHLNHSL